MKIDGTETCKNEPKVANHLWQVNKIAEANSQMKGLLGIC